MTKNILLSTAAMVCLLTACNKQLSNADSNFDVNVNATTVNVGDTNRFSFTGNPDVITFYSGETGSRYEYRNRDTANGTPLLRFRTIRANGSQVGSLSLMVSDNFEGVLVSDTPATVNRIAAATWTDITSRATLSSGSTTAVASGNIDLSDFSTAGKPVYIAFKYQGFSGSAQSKWTIDSFAVRNVLNDGTSYIVANMNASNTAYTNYGVSGFSPGFAAFRSLNNYYWVITNGTSLVITGATSAGTASPAEAWAVIGPVNLKKVTPDIGKPVKMLIDKIQDLEWMCRYTTPGSYNAVFSGGKISAKESEYTTRSFQITVK